MSNSMVYVYNNIMNIHEQLLYDWLIALLRDMNDTFLEHFWKVFKKARLKDAHLQAFRKLNTLIYSIHFLSIENIELDIHAVE